MPGAYGWHLISRPEGSPTKEKSMKKPEHLEEEHAIAAKFRRALERIARKALAIERYGELRHILDALEYNAGYLDGVGEEYERLLEAARPDAGGVQ